jgi:HK97 family phage portal protein
MGWIDTIIEKLSPAQRTIAQDQGEQPTTQTKLHSVELAFQLVEVVNRCVNLTVDNTAMIDFEVGATLNFTGMAPGMRKDKLNTLLNTRPNPYMDISNFRRLSLMDFLIDGNMFWYFDGSSLYHLPAANMVVIPDEKTYVNSYEYNFATTGDNPLTFSPSSIIHIKDNSVTSMYRGDSRIMSAMQSLYGREDMLDFQSSFFKNGTSMGLIIETEQILSARMKERQEREWMVKYNPKKGNGKPVILDAGMKAKATTNTNFKEMAFLESISEAERKVCIALGIPPILIDSGNNANIKPNLELWFYTTLIPMMRKVEAAVEMFFAYDVELTTHRVPALLPDKTAETTRITSLVNNGIITGNEGRAMMKLAAIDEEVMNKIRVPANVAGSATGVAGQEGGRPSGTEND